MANLYTRPTDNVVFDLEITDGGMARTFKKNDEAEKVVIERHFKFFEIESTLKQIVYDLLDPMRKQTLKESNINKKNAEIISILRGNVTELQYQTK